MDKFKLIHLANLRATYANEASAIKQAEKQVEKLKGQRDLLQDQIGRAEAYAASVAPNLGGPDAAVAKAIYDAAADDAIVKFTREEGPRPLLSVLAAMEEGFHLLVQQERAEAALHHARMTYDRAWGPLCKMTEGKPYRQFRIGKVFLPDSDSGEVPGLDGDDD